MCRTQDGFPPTRNTRNTSSILLLILHSLILITNQFGKRSLFLLNNSLQATQCAVSGWNAKKNPSLILMKYKQNLLILCRNSTHFAKQPAISLTRRGTSFRTQYPKEVPMTTKKFSVRVCIYIYIYTKALVVQNQLFSK